MNLHYGLTQLLRHRRVCQLRVNSSDIIALRREHYMAVPKGSGTMIRCLAVGKAFRALGPAMSAKLRTTLGNLLSPVLSYS
jgi:hypothetical protein